jgi:molybdenum cofactor guanylyltransferase
MVVTAAILAGGKSSRMGQSVDKAFVLLENKPLVEHVLARVHQFDPTETLIISNTPERYAAYSGVIIYPDRIKDSGPLGGICVALEHAVNENVIIVGCDMPFINPALLAYLVNVQLSATTPYDVVVPRYNNQAQGLCALYNQACLPTIQRRLAEGRLSLMGLFEDVNTRFVDRLEYADFEDGHSFTNINTPDELNAAQNR